MEYTTGLLDIAAIWAIILSGIILEYRDGFSSVAV